MALPLPRVVADVGPGGPLVTAMSGMNALNNDMLLRKINEVKAQYAPLTTQAEAASKLAYANLMGPQFLAKLMGNEGALANMTEGQKSAALDLVRNAGMGGGSGQNIFSQMQQAQMSPGERMGNSLSNFFADKLKNIFGGQTIPQGAINPQLPNTMAGISHVESGGASNPYTLIGKDTGNGDHALGKYQVLASNVPEWTKEALGQSMTPQEFLNSPEAQERTAAYWMNKHLNKGYSPQDVGSIWFTGKPLNKAGNVRDSYGTTPTQYVQRMNEGMNEAQERPKTYAEKAAEYKGILKEGEKLGETRAQAISDLDEQYQQAVQAEVPVDHLVEMTQDPIFQNMANKVPFFRDKQLQVLSKIGTPEEQKRFGDFTTTATNAVANTVSSFRGRILDKEITLANQMKISPKDTWNTMLGKLATIKTFNEMTKQRARIASRLMQEKHLNRGEAIEQADKQIDGKEIRKKVEEQLNPKPTEEDYKHMMEKYGISRDEVIKRMKAKGHL